MHLDEAFKQIKAVTDGDVELDTPKPAKGKERVVAELSLNLGDDRGQAAAA
jgi:hypothetical protein